MKLTLKNIADDLNLSKATVSLVLNGKAKEKKVNSETARKVTEYCKKKNYVLNVHAKRMNSKLAQNIGLLLYGKEKNISNPLSEYCASMIAGGLAMEASKSSFSTTLLIFQDENDLDALLQRFYSRELDGFVSANFPLWDSWNKAFKKNKIPVAIIGGNPKEDLPTLNINDFEMSFAMTERAIRSGRNKMAFLAGYETSHTGNERKHGFLKALKKNGLSHCGVHSCDFNEELAYKNTLRIIKDENLHFDSLICANDSMAVGAAKALLEKDYKIPEDVLVTGADGTDLLKYFTPHLPTYSMLPEKRGEESFKLLKAQFDGELKNKHIVIESKLETWGVI